MSIKIGDKNKINKSIIAGTVNGSVEPTEKGWFVKHPVLGGLIISLVAGFILLFSFWNNIIQIIEG